MKARNIIAMCLVPLMMSSCGQNPVPDRISEEDALSIVNTFSTSTESPSYEVTGYAIYCGEKVTILGADESGVAKFKNPIDLSDPDANPYYKTKYPVYNLGYYPSNPVEGYQDRSDAPIHYNASKSYWSRCPLRINKDNYLTTYLPSGTTEEITDPYCAKSIIETNFIISGSTNEGIIYSANQVNSTEGNSGNKGLTIQIIDTNARLTIYNFQKYETRLDRVYSNSQAGARLNVKLIYDNDGWLTYEEISSTNLKSTETVQNGVIYLQASYTWNHA